MDFIDWAYAIKLLPIMATITCGLWYGYELRTTPRSPVRLVLFPSKHFRSFLELRRFPAVFPIGFCYIVLIAFAVGALSPSSPHAQVACWSAVLIFLLYALTAYLTGTKQSRHLLLIAVTAVILVAGAATWTILARDYQVMNAFDFAVQIYTLAVSVAVVAGIIIHDRFVRDLEAFFIFFGLIIYSCLQILSTIVLALDFRANFNFSFAATLLLLLFWLVSLPWIHRLRSKLT